MQHIALCGYKLSALAHITPEWGKYVTLFIFCETQWVVERWGKNGPKFYALTAQVTTIYKHKKQKSIPEQVITVSTCTVLYVISLFV